jgi:glutamate:GABA antiporter
VVTGVFQGIAAGAGHVGRALLLLAPLAAAFATVGRVGAVGAWLSGSARVAFVVGLDRYFPPAFGRVHPRWRTPYVAILVATAISTAFLLLAVLGKGTTLGTAFLTLLDMSLYLYLFACYLAHCRRSGAARLLTPGGRPAAVAFAVAGICVTLFSMIVATIPPPDTANPFLFVAKVVGGTMTLIAVAGAIYLRGRSAAAAERLRRAA